MTRGYRVRQYVNGRAEDGTEYFNYSLTVPKEIAEHLPDGMTFLPKMTDDGILYQPVQIASKSVDLPDWAKNNGNGGSKKKNSTTEGESA